LNDGGQGILVLPSLQDHTMMVNWVQQQVAIFEEQS
jgi:hypothetical protein